MLEILTKTFMDVPWAKPKTFPDCALLCSADGSKERGHVTLTEPTGKESVFYVRTTRSAAGSPPTLEIPFRWPEDGETQTSWRIDGSLHTWLPWDRLVTALSIRAMEHAMRKRTAVMPAKFEGSLLDGIDTKPTIRAFSRGEEQFYVREPAKGENAEADLSPSFPVVWILNPHDPAETAWTMLREPCSYMERYIRDRRSLAHVVKERGSNMTAIMAYGSRSAMSYDSAVKKECYQGILLFQPICWTNEQFARWAESTGYRRNPFFESGFFESDLGLVRKLLARDHLQPDDGARASTVLLLAALPFAKQTLVVVAPAGYHVDRTVLQHAKRLDVEILLVPLKPVFPAGRG